ncbi:MAG TPA: hypothetical protein VH255_05590 [Verrucomicrobiae bacterium]|jgi:hypothetical protein|nr:hypothetical protein [Verrucomicrobiae bacterium]
MWRESDLIGKRGTVLACALLSLLFTSCKTPHVPLRGQFQSYNIAYGDALNQQMLLNLARLQNGHPAYYLAIGAINNKFNLTEGASVGGTGAFTDSKNTVDNSTVSGGVLKLTSQAITYLLSPVFGFNASANISHSSSPDFQFIPLNNEGEAKQVLEPISTDVFFALYEQGYPIDQLLRVMIERIETPTLADGEKLVLVNSPTESTPEYYARFLRACAILRTLQIHGYLRLQANNELELLGPVSFGGAAAKGGPSGGGHGETSMPPAGAESGNPTLKDFSDAADKDMVLRTNANGGWLLYQKHPNTKFVLRDNDDDLGTLPDDVPKDWMIRLLRPDYRTQSFFTNLPPGKQMAMDNFAKFVTSTITFVETNEATAEIKDPRAIVNVVMALSRGISVQTVPGDVGQGATRLVLRSFNRAMEGVATEQAGFETLACTNATFASIVPVLENRPILKMLWNGRNTNSLEPPLQTLHYSGKTYVITDPKISPLEPAERWNRDVFRLMVALSSQVTVDISKFQRQVFELSQ